MPPSWPNVEQELLALPRREVVALAARAAARLAPALAQAGEHYGPEAFEWMRAVLETIRTVERHAAGERVTRFTLDLAADAARCAANAMANASRVLGPAGCVEACELAIAAAAFAADSARATTPGQAVGRALQALQAAGEVPPPTGPLWPDGEPTWFTEGLARYHQAVAERPGAP